MKIYSKEESHAQNNPGTITTILSRDAEYIWFTFKKRDSWLLLSPGYPPASARPVFPSNSGNRAGQLDVSSFKQLLQAIQLTVFVRHKTLAVTDQFTQLPSYFVRDKTGVQ